MSRFPRLPPRLTRVFERKHLYFVTFCTYRRRPFLATQAVHEAFTRFGETAYSTHNIAVGRYVIMPDHLHLFVCGSVEFQLGRWISMLKQVLGKTVSYKGDDPVWQRGFFDHVLRSQESYGQKWNYVRDNPVRAGLAVDPNEWPYAGEIVYIDRP